MSGRAVPGRLRADDRMTTSDRRLIEDYLPVDWLSAEASGEPRTKGHISTLHLRRARRPLTACRAAVYSALVSAPSSAEERERQDNFLKALCQWDAPDSAVQKARQRILEDRDAPPRVPDLFAGGGAIPLEALRLGCDAYALDLNPVAFLILKGTCEYPQRFGGALSGEVRRWAERVAERTRIATSAFYPTIPTPDGLEATAKAQTVLEGTTEELRTLTPFVFLWARTVPCPNPQCGAVVPLYRQTWAAKETVRLCRTASRSAPRSTTRRVRRSRRFFAGRTRVRPCRRHAHHGHALSVLRLRRFRRVCARLRSRQGIRPAASLRHLRESVRPGQALSHRRLLD